MPDDRQLARDILAGKVSLEDASRNRRTSPPPIEPPKSNAADAPPPIPTNEPPEEKPPTLTSAPPAGKKFPCQKCGARLDFDPRERALKCPYCGHVEEIAPAKESVTERDYEAALAKDQHESGVITNRSQEVRCPACGAMILLEDNIETDKCPFCATHIENVPRTQARSMIVPESVLPFKLSQRDAVPAFNNWIRSRWFAPNNLKQLANLGQLSGIYLPFWTYDSMTYSHYTGQRGDDYYVTETYTTTENGRSVTRTRQVRKTRWTYVSGEVDHFFDDVLVVASKSLPTNYVNELEPWDLHDLQPFNPAYLAGFKTERYTVSLAEGFTVARQIMDAHIRQLIQQDIGGDHQRISTVQTQNVGITYKHLLLPLWLAVYRYQQKTFRILVNARTGEVTGARPYSWIKITLAVIAALLALAVILYLVNQNRDSSSRSSNSTRIEMHR
jgi:DNA-directed RNA polymerase subunit RPC12/RpoP